MAWPIEEPTATPLQRKRNVRQGLGKTSTGNRKRLTRQSRPSARTVPIHRSAASEEPAAPAAGERPSSEAAAAGGRAEQVPDAEERL